jgi:hypothetical protein
MSRLPDVDPVGSIYHRYALMPWLINPKKAGARRKKPRGLFAPNAKPLCTRPPMYRD